MFVRVSRLVANTRSECEFRDAIKSIPSNYRLLSFEWLILCASPVSLWGCGCPVGFLNFVISILFLLGLYYFSVLFFIGSLVWFYSFCVFKFLLRHSQLIVLTTYLKNVRLFLSFFLVPLNVYVYSILRIVFWWTCNQIYFIFCLNQFLTIFYWLGRSCWN